MAKLLFKKGSYDEFKSKVLDTGVSVDGALYLTEDEGGLYLGTGTAPKRISGSVLFFASLDEFEQGVKPPYSTDVIYFLADRDALVRWNGTRWIVLNQTAESVTAAIDEINNSIKAINTTLNTVKNTANGALQTSGGTMSGDINMGGNSVTNLKTPAAATDAVTKKYVDDKASALLGAANAASTTETIRGALTGVSEAKAAAQSASDEAKAADTKAGNAMARANQMLPLDGTGTMQGALDAGNFNVINVAAPSADHHAVNRKYVTDQVTTLNAAITTAQTKANEAAGAASAAQTSADLAQQTANTAKANAATAQTAAENANANAETRVLKSDFESFKTTNTARINDVEDAAENAQGTADAAQRDIDDIRANVLPGKLNLTGGTMKGAIDMGKNLINNVGDPSAEGDAVNKKYVDGKIATANAGIVAATNAAEAAQKAAEDADAAADNAQNTADTALSNAAKAQKAADDAQKDADDAMSRANEAYANADSRVAKDTFEAFKTSNSNAISAVEGKANAAQDTANAALPKQGGTMNANNIGINMNSGKITNLAAPVNGGDATNKTYVDTEVAAAKTYAEQLVASNDAMTFKGVINATSDLPTAANTSKRGDTYKVGTKGTYNGVEAKVGDLFINTAADDAVPVWEHVSSGYEDDYLQKLKYDASTGKIFLTDGVSENYLASAALGAFLFEGDSATNLKLSITPNASRSEFTVTASMEWDSF